MLFNVLQRRLVDNLRDRVRAGEVTERNLARLTGMSQPHMHHVLKGARSLSPEYADRIVTYFNLSVSDLLTPGELGVPGPFLGATVSVPRLDGSAGPARRMGNPTLESYPLPAALTDFLQNPVMLELAYDPELFPHFQAGDLALIDRAPLLREGLRPDAVYLVRTEAGTLARCVRAGGARLYLVTPRTLSEPRKWESLALWGRDLNELIEGRIAWIGRPLGDDPFGVKPPEPD